MSKRIQISPDSDTTWYTFPGNKGDFNLEAGDIKDTIFGQDYQSDQTGMISWTINANGLFKGFAGYVAKIKKAGSTTAFTDEATTLVTGKTYKISAATKNVWDRNQAITVKDGSTNVTDEVESVDWLFGRFTFLSSYTPVGAITVSGKYLPMTQVGGANSFTLTQTASTIDTSDYESAQGNDGYRTYEYGLKTVKLALKGIYKSSNAFKALLSSRVELVIEINPDGSSKSVARGFFKPMSTGQSGNVGELEDESLDFSLSVPDQVDVLLPFKWIHDSTSTLSSAIQHALTAWQNNTVTRANYLEDGTNGIKGDAVITDISLSGGLDVMNEFSIKFQGSDAYETHP